MIVTGDFDPNLIITNADGIFCSFCQQKLKTFHSAKVHIERKHLIPRTVVQCKICSKTYIHKANFRQHVVNVHEKRGDRNLVENYGIIVANETC